MIVNFPFVFYDGTVLFTVELHPFLWLSTKVSILFLFILSGEIKMC